MSVCHCRVVAVIIRKKISLLSNYMITCINVVRRVLNIFFVNLEKNNMIETFNINVK